MNIVSGLVHRLYSFLFGGDLKIYWILALFGTILFFIQFILTLFGFGGLHDVDTDGLDADGVDIDHHIDTGFTAFKLFSIRSVLAFITFFGWGGVLWGDQGISGFFAALASGFAMMFATATLLYFLMRLQHSGNINAEDIIGATGTVYLSIPEGKKGTGKVTVNLPGCTREIMAYSEESLEKGTPVKVIKKIDSRTFVVEKI